VKKKANEKTTDDYLGGCKIFWWFNDLAHMVPPVEWDEEACRAAEIEDAYDWVAIREQLWAIESGYVDF
jgi:hypothetical protein